VNVYRNLYRGHTQRFKLSKCSKTHRGLPRKIMVVKLFLKHPIYIYILNNKYQNVGL
jgi:hypothetical protein